MTVPMTDDLCSVSDCERPIYARGWCSTHYSRWIDHGDVRADVPVRFRSKAATAAPGEKVCTIDGCDRTLQARGWCQTHYMRWKNHGDPLGGRPTSPGDGLKFIESLVEQYHRAELDPGECIRWPYGTNGRGYGLLQYLGRPRAAQRVVLMVLTGHKAPGMHSRHLCGNPICVNPHHLAFGTASENHLDAAAHGTLTRGEDCSWAKLTESDVRAIRRLAAETDLSHGQIAETYDCSRENISQIVRRDSWAHVEDEVQADV